VPLFIHLFSAHSYSRMRVPGRSMIVPWRVHLRDYARQRNGLLLVIDHAKGMVRPDRRARGQRAIAPAAQMTNVFDLVEVLIDGPPVWPRI
jgi:hypothetical protein